MQLTGSSLIGFSTPATAGSDIGFRAVDPATGAELEPLFHSATTADVERAAHLAHAAFAVTKSLPGAVKAAFLRRIASGLDEARAAIIERAQQETALPAARVESELGRTMLQLRLFADLVEEGSWVDARIEHGDAARQPLPKPDLRSMLRPLGPTVVFGASNFPLAYSVAGGDTAAALASGCPVIVKAHPAHPGTSEIVGRAVCEAAQSCEMPDGVFSLLFDKDYEIGLALVRHPHIKAVGFTGSRRGGRALMDAAAAREEPIPVFAEMSSINPIVITPGALQARGDEIAAGLYASVTQGVGQFCTNPGLVLLPEGEVGTAFLDDLATRMSATAPGTMLTSNICSAYGQGTEKLADAPGVAAVVAPAPDTARAGAALFETAAATLLANRELMAEVFGPSTLVVRYESPAELREVARGLEGQLTATLHASDEELADNTDLLAILEEKAGRLLVNGFPTGVEVGHAIVHGGPYPATSDGQSTSVGSRAIRRFTRPVCFQNFPDAALPPELQETNPLGIRRLVDGVLVEGTKPAADGG